jgi:hypothetical protein
MATEKLKFKLELYSTYWDKPPIAEIFLNEQCHFNKEITGTKIQPTIITFEHVLKEGEKYQLGINRWHKNARQTVVTDNGMIIKDQLLHIKSIEIDEIDIGALVYEAVYTPEYPEPWATQQKQAGKELPESFKNVTTIGHNGRWVLSFESPFYMWLLENLY